jgi:hypothetical protein
MFTIGLPVQLLALQKEVWVGSFIARSAEGDRDTHWILLRLTKATMFFCLRSTVRPHDVIFRIEKSILREYLLIREHHPSNCNTTDVLPDPLTTSFSQWFLLVFKHLYIDLSVASFV